MTRQALADCRCDHTARAHEHYTWRENCSVCPCPDYRPPGTDWAAIAVWAVVILALAAFWTAVWLGITR